MTFTIEEITRYPVKLPFRDRPGKHLFRELPHWQYFEVIEVELADGAVGFGETMLFYTWEKTDKADIEAAIGKSGFELIWDDSIGPGLQIGLLDALGKSLGIPSHQLLGQQVRENVPLSHWCIDMPADDWVREVEYGLDKGYATFKVKGRPWFDLRAQIRALENCLPSDSTVTIDFNSTLLTADKALPLLNELDSSPIVSHFEDPLQKSDVDGNRKLMENLETPIIIHYGEPSPRTAMLSDMADGMVLNGGITSIKEANSVSKVAKWPSWLQMVGSELTTAFVVQLGAIMDNAVWPSITCNEMYGESLVKTPLSVVDGSISVPSTPGLGVTIDRNVLEEYQIDTRPDKKPTPKRLIKMWWPSGPVFFFAGKHNGLLEYARLPGTDIPYFREGGSVQLIEDDGTSTWAELWENAQRYPVKYESPAATPY